MANGKLPIRQNKILKRLRELKNKKSEKASVKAMSYEVAWTITAIKHVMTALAIIVGY